MYSCKVLSSIGLAALLALAVPALCAENSIREPALPAGAITRLLASADANLYRVPHRAAQIQAWARRLYAIHGDLPLWVGRNRDVAQALLQELGAAERYGLHPADYAVHTSLPGKDEQDSAHLSRFDLELTVAALHFLSDLHSGRTVPDIKWYGGRRQPDAFDPVQLLTMAIQQTEPSAAIAAAEPQSAMYARVKQTLARYRELEPKSKQLAPLPALPPRRDAATPYPGSTGLRQRLALLGDMADGGSINGTTLEAGLKNFQMRHGLAQDGILGKSTMAALAVPLSQRIRQLELTLERLRWLPKLPPGPLIVVNVPSFRLWAIDTSVEPSRIELDMRVIVGNSASTPTPLLIAQLHHLEFNPAWNVPRSIEIKEFIPKLERDPDFLRKQDLELVPRNALAGAEPNAPLESLRAGTMRLRQRPGPRNALGAVKFSMPNPLSIYLHGTPATALFAKTRRDLSHGCIRLERPDELAVFALRNEEGWDRAAVAAAMEPGPTRTVALNAPIPVVVLYASALTDRRGQALFLPDAYGLDKKLAAALEAGHGATPDAPRKAAD